MIFDSHNQKYRSPFGAVQAGTPVSFRLELPRSWCCDGVFLHVGHEFGGEEFRYAADWRGIEDECDVYRAVLDTTHLLGPVWYHFSYLASGRPAGYFGPPPGHSGGAAARYDAAPPQYQLTVFEKNDTPAWYGQGVTYQIFPDRFRRSRMPDTRGMVGSRHIHEDWSDCPDFMPDKNGEIRNADFFGGDLRGVMDKLEYLSGLGVKTIYFSPIFEAASNHRYDTADYLRVDPMLGTEEDFKALCEQARSYGMRVILDGVFNHTGFDSRYFNGRGTYPELGAYQSQDSPYYKWYNFTSWPEGYESWWGVYTLPAVRESEPSYREFILSGKDSAVRKWLRLGASGWRLDVADELPDSFIEELRTAVREEVPDGIVIGEVWEDASNKVSYSERRRYLLGRELDGVMNYPFRDACIAYVLGGNSREFILRMESLRENYPRASFYSLMNSLGTHDTPRILTVLGADAEDWALTKTQKSLFRLSPEKRALAVKRLKIASAIMYTFPGSPTVYYGDEAGLEGFEDPFNRRGYPWGGEDAELLAWFTGLGALRGRCRCLREGEITYAAAPPPVLAYKRSAGKREEMYCLFNRSGEPAGVTLSSGSHMKDALSGTVYAPVRGKCKVSVPPMSALLLEKQEN